MRVSVIIPIYKVERYIGRCAESLMCQTLADVEFIFVDDASPDGSISVLRSVLAKYPSRNARIIAHDINLGLPAARNTGLAAAKGDYIYHCDSDDFLEPDMLESLYSKALESDADMVYCDFFITFAKKERYMSVGNFPTPALALKAMLSGAMKYNVWNKLVRRTLYAESGITFPAGHGMGEDMTMMMLTACAASIAYVPRALYHYLKINANAFSNTFSQRHLDDILFNTRRIIDFLSIKYGDAVHEDIEIFKLGVKFPFLISDDKAMHRLWREWFPEANAYIDRANVSARSRLLQKAAANGNWWYVSLYYRIIFKFVYGILYK